MQVEGTTPLALLLLSPYSCLICELSSSLVSLHPFVFFFFFFFFFFNSYSAIATNTIFTKRLELPLAKR